MTISNVSSYTKSFVYPLFEETHSDLLSKILGVNRAPTAEIVKVKTSKGFKLPKTLLYTILLKRRQGSYIPEAGDLIALTDGGENCAECCISKTGGMSLLKIKEALKNFQLDNSQETAILSCTEIQQS
ncbi:hypothetical protein Tco_0845371 [Tanacetum coccineum]